MDIDVAKSTETRTFSGRVRWEARATCQLRWEPIVTYIRIELQRPANLPSCLVYGVRRPPRCAEPAIFGGEEDRILCFMARWCGGIVKQGRVTLQTRMESNKFISAIFREALPEGDPLCSDKDGTIVMSGIFFEKTQRLGSWVILKELLSQFSHSPGLFDFDPEQFAQNPKYTNGSRLYLIQFAKFPP